MSDKLQDELLALLDGESNDGSVSSPSQRHQQPYRRAGSQSGSRSSPSTFNHWANARTKNKTRNEHPGEDKLHGRSSSSLSLSDVSTRIRTLSPQQRYYLTLAIATAGVCILFLTKVIYSSWHESSPVDIAAPSARSSFLDLAWRGKESVQFETLTPPSEIDFAIQRRLSIEEESESICDDILLYLPRSPVQLAHVDDLNTYLLTALLATYLGKAMVILESPDAPPGLDCSPDALEDKSNKYESIPTKLSQFIQHPRWLSRGCPVPCQATFDYAKWNGVSNQLIKQITCQNDNNRQTRVFAVGGDDMKEQMKMVERPFAMEKAYDWALRLGATGYEAQAFASLTEEGQIWDFLSALLARSGAIRFQPWIAGDVRALIEMTELPLNTPYAAVSVHSGIEESTAEELGPLDLAPFQDYVRLLDTSDCTANDDVAYPVYISTDDPERVRDGIERLPKGPGGDAIIDECFKMSFIFSPIATNAPGADDASSCAELYRRNVASIADMMILTKSDTFVGEMNSFGMFVRSFRAVVNNFPGRRRDGPVLVRDARFVPGTVS